MDAANLILSFGVLIFASHLLNWLFSHTKIPDALLLIIFGLIIGPAFGILAPEYFGETSQLIVTIVLVTVLFQGGLNLDIRTLRNAWRSTILISIIGFLSVMILVGLTLWAIYGLNILLALTIGSMIGGTSSAIVIPLLRHLSASEESETVLTLESVFTDVLAIVTTIALLKAYVSNSFSATVLTLNIFGSFFIAAIIGLFVGMFWARVLSIVKQIRNSVFTTPALVFLLYGVTQWLGLSGPIAVLAFSIFMGNVPRLHAYLEQRHTFLRYVLWPTSPGREERLLFDEVALIMQTFFFVFVGISLRLESLGTLLTGILLTVLMVITRALVIKYFVPKETTKTDATIMATMIPKGLAAAALATLPLQLEIGEGTLIQEIVYSVIILSIITTSLLVFSTHKTRLSQYYATLFKRFS
jgi:NhaP-type Na+/H+ or K+/H+ antiporter